MKKKCKTKSVLHFYRSLYYTTTLQQYNKFLTSQHQNLYVTRKNRLGTKRLGTKGGKGLTEKNLI